MLTRRSLVLVTVFHMLATHYSMLATVFICSLLATHYSLLQNSVSLAAVLFGFLLFVPLEVFVRQRAAELVESVLVVDHFFARVAGHGKLVLQKDRLLRADLLAHAAVDAAQHVDFELLRRALDMRVGRIRRDFTGRDADGFRRADEFAELARDAILAPAGNFHERRHPAIRAR